MLPHRRSLALVENQPTRLDSSSVQTQILYLFSSNLQPLNRKPISLPKSDPKSTKHEKTLWPLSPLRCGTASIFMTLKRPGSTPGGAWHGSSSSIAVAAAAAVAAVVVGVRAGVVVVTAAAAAALLQYYHHIFLNMSVCLSVGLSVYVCLLVCLYRYIDS